MTDTKNAKLKLIKLGLIFSLIIYVFSTLEFSSVPIIDGYANKPSFFSNENCTLFINDVVNNHQRTIELKNIATHHSQSFTILGIRQDTLKKAWKNGFGYKMSGSIYLSGQESGIYQIDNKIPIIIKPPINEQTDLLIVVPYLNYQAHSNAGGKSFFAHNSLKSEAAVQLSFNRPIVITDYEFTIAQFANQYLKKYKVGYISDLDILFYKQIEKTKMLLFYGNMSFISPQMRKNIDLFIASGGNILFTNNHFMNNIVRLDLKRKQILFAKNNQKLPNQWNDSTLKQPNYQTVGASYEIGFPVDSFPLLIRKNIKDNELTIRDTLHPIFKDLPNSQKNISISCTLWNGPPLLGLNESALPIIDSTKLAMYYYKVLAYKWSEYNGYKLTIGSISEFQKKQDSGICINMGCGCWIDSLSNNKIHAELLQNAIQYLQEKSMRKKIY